MPCARSLSTSATLALLLFSACNPPAGTGPSPGRLAPPATFVLAWTGPGGAILTVESGDGAMWRRRTAHDTTRSRDFGPVLAHDGRLNWMLMWADGAELQYKIGIGGASAAGGIVWESVPTTGVLPVRPGSSPDRAGVVIAHAGLALPGPARTVDGLPRECRSRSPCRSMSARTRLRSTTAAARSTAWTPPPTRRSCGSIPARSPRRATASWFGGAQATRMATR